MTAGRESDFAEVLVDRLFLESFPNEQSPYFVREADGEVSRSLDKFRDRLKWHINNSLSKRQKEVIRYYLRGKKEREIASILGITQQVVHIYQHRAINKLKMMSVS